ncbi:FeoA family protein [Aquirufa sp. KTFRIE-69F]|uniref:FeoA family protein n=3 Tax=Aquirufa TaxID=2676247 RepID=A0ABW6D6E0_9BACT|nr:FeoA family protein [Aquirufa lenticrescens]MBP6094729.1 ferrous iron transport protein A [Cytophagaceae bacterium]MCX6193582.1 FeoA family protein [Cytophagales bacterium]UAJ13273.1 ferrous iron transport protein A [Aquirufa lenticrescens]
MSMANLADLKIGEKGEIVGFTDELLSLKLLEMGCLPGTEVILTHLAPFGDPIAIRVSGSYTLSMRREEAETMLIKRT